MPTQDLPCWDSHRTGMLCTPIGGLPGLGSSQLPKRNDARDPELSTSLSLLPPVTLGIQLFLWVPVSP